MRIKIEDYYGNDLCSFRIDGQQLTEKNLTDLIDCSYADSDIDGEGEYIRIQLNSIQ